MKVFKTFDDTNKVTSNFLQFCYMCDDKHKCTTEEACRQCWADKNVDTEGNRNETSDMLTSYYA
ncbi:hypothetical protein [Paenibacillus marinisediminis]